MAERNTSEGFCQTRAVLGDLTNRLGKRGFSEREKRGIKKYYFNDKDEAKRLRVSPQSCTEVDSLKGNVVSGVSIMNNENTDANVVSHGCSPVSKSSIDVGTDCNDGNCWKGENSEICNSNYHGVDKDITVLDVGGETAISLIVTELDDDKAMVDSCEKIGNSDGGSLQNMDKMDGQDDKDPNLTDLVRGRAMSFISPLADGCSRVDLLKEKEIFGTAEIVCENKSFSLSRTVRGNAPDLKINGSGEVALSSSAVSKGENDLRLTDLQRENAFESVDFEADGDLCDKFPPDTSRTVSGSGGNCPHNGKDFSVDGSKASPEGTQSDAGDYQNDGDDYNADNFFSSQCGSIDCTILPESQESRFGIEKSMEMKEGDECSLSGGTDSIKSCSCSFCTKAAYIWLDLNYQDIKARVSAMRKMQKEASIMAEKSIRNKIIDKHGAESFNTVSKLESGLIHQWKSLFRNMADMWEEESNQLEARLLPLTDLREKCKRDLALINAPPSEKHEGCSEGI